MMKGAILLVLGLLMPVVSAQATSNSILCSDLHIFCPVTSVVQTYNIPVDRNATGIANTSINSSTNLVTFGTVRQVLDINQQYIYQVEINRTNYTNVIYSFLLLGSFNGNNVYSPPAYTNCTLTSIVSCRTTFIVQFGNYSEMEVRINGVWKYALKLPSTAESNLTASAIVIPRQPNYTLPIALGIVVVICVIAGGNYWYYERHKGELYKIGKVTK
jgi:hypothetical protein